MPTTGTTLILQAPLGKFIASIPLCKSSELIPASGPEEGRRRPPSLATEPRDLNATDFVRANQRLLSGVLCLDAGRTEQQLRDALENFYGRHRNLLDILRRELLKWKTRSRLGAQLNKTQRGLIGAYFLNEYSSSKAGAVQSEYRPVSGSTRRSGKRLPIYFEPSCGRRRTRASSPYISIFDHPRRRSVTADPTARLCRSWKVKATTPDQWRSGRCDLPLG